MNKFQHDHMTTSRYTSNYNVWIYNKYRSQDLTFQSGIGLYFALKSTIGMDRHTHEQAEKIWMDPKNNIVLKHFEALEFQIDV